MIKISKYVAVNFIENIYVLLHSQIAEGRWSMNTIKQTLSKQLRP